MAMLMGHRGVEGMPEAVGISTHLARLETMMEGAGVLEMYAELSEIAHPNWMGVNYLFSRIDGENLTTWFGRNPSDRHGLSTSTAIKLKLCLLIFEHAYQRISELIPVYLGELSPL
jgi:hypothetical protein